MSDAAESARLQEIARLEKAGAFAGPHLQKVLELARTIFDIENVAVTIVGAKSEWCAAKCGAHEELPRHETFCQTTIQNDELVVSCDTRTDERFANLPTVVQDYGIRFYAGAPLITRSGQRIGALCLRDSQPRSFCSRNEKALRDLADLAMDHMELVAANEAATFDSLTRLRNREFLLAAMDASISDDRACTALLIDLDGFKDINDSLGHAFGDQALAIVAERLTAFRGEDNVVARLGGDEFVIFLDSCSDVVVAASIAARVVTELAQPIVIGGHLLNLGASVGVAVRTDETGALALLDHADLATYQAKTDGRGRYRVFQRSMRAKALERGNIMLELQEAWEDGALELYYQPIVRLSDGAWIGAEALLRWNYPYRGVLPPAMFLPVLEKSNLAIKVGTWIIRDACRQAAEWRRIYDPAFKVAINLFEVQFKTGDLVDIVEEALAAQDLPASALKIEITENVILAQDRRIVEQIKQLKDMGVGIAFDDFGTGFASLSALKDYPVTCLKIDKSFVGQATSSNRDLSIVDALIHIAETFGLSVVAEGVETEEQRDLMKQRRCLLAQGYFFSRPVTTTRFEATWPEHPARIGTLPAKPGMKSDAA